MLKEQYHSVFARLPESSLRGMLTVEFKKLPRRNNFTILVCCRTKWFV